MTTEVPYEPEANGLTVFSLGQETEAFQAPNGRLEIRAGDAWIKLHVSFRRRLLAELQGSKLSVFLCLCLHINDRNECDPTVGMIARETGYSDRQVRSSIKELQDMGLLRVAREAGRRSAYCVNLLASYGSNRPLADHQGSKNPGSPLHPGSPLQDTPEVENGNRLDLPIEHLLSRTNKKNHLTPDTPKEDRALRNAVGLDREGGGSYSSTSPSSLMDKTGPSESEGMEENKEEGAAPAARSRAAPPALEYVEEGDEWGDKRPARPKWQIPPDNPYLKRAMALAGQRYFTKHEQRRSWKVVAQGLQAGVISPAWLEHCLEVVSAQVREDRRSRPLLNILVYMANLDRMRNWENVQFAAQPKGPSTRPMEYK